MTGGISLGRIVAEITANTAGLRRGAADAERILNDTSNNASAAGKAIGVAFAVTAALGVMKLIDKLEDCTQVAIDNKKALMGLESVAKAYGVSMEDAAKITKDFTRDGLIQMKNAATGMKNILSTGFSISEAMNLSQALKDIGAFNNVVVGGLGVAFEDVTKGMRTGSIELIENIGLTQRLSAVMKQAQKQAQASGDTERARQLDISNGIDLTNNAAQREAFYNMVLKEGEKFKGNAAKLAESQASSQAKANAAIKEAADAIGNRLLPTYSTLMDIVTNASKSIAGIFSDDRIDKANKYAQAINEQKTDFLILANVYEQLATKTNKSAEEMKLYKDTIAQMKKLYPDYLGNLDMEKGKYEDVAKAIDQVNKKLALKAVYAKKEQELSGIYEDMANAQIKIQEITIKTETDIARWKSLGMKFTPGRQPITFEEYRAVFQKDIDKYRKDIENYQNKINAINDKYMPILGGYDAKAEEKAKADAENKRVLNAKLKAEEDAKKNISDKTPKVKITPEIEITDPEPSWIEVQNLIYGQFAKIEPEIKPVFNLDNMEIAKQQLAVGLTDFSKYQTTFAQQGTGGISKIAAGLMDLSNYGVVAVETSNNIEYVNKTLEDVTKSFSELAGVLNNDVIDALSNVINEAMSMSDSINGFSAAQNATDYMGMLSSGIGIFSSAVSIFSSISSLFSDSTYNFDEAVEKMLKGIGEKTPTGQVAEYEKIKKLQDFYSKYGITEGNQVNMWQNGKIKDEFKNISAEAAALSKELGVGSILYNTGSRVGMSQSGQEILANLEKIIPQLAEQLSTTASDFGSAIGSALSSATTSEELKANLYDGIYGTVKSGLINAFLAGEVMKPLLDNLQQTVTLAVADGIMSPEEKAAIQALMGDVGVKTDEFYSALEAVGLNVVDAAGQLNEAANRMDNVNRNLRLADRISTITTQTGTIGIPPLLSGGSVVYDFSNANLGGMTEQQVISAVSKANRMASIKRTGV